ncbi:heme O synthase, protoheme IX farnesyltransferase COX10-CtaB [Bacillus sp. JCM 19045]|uniref:Protoheme IX farnesyltransferase n=1 Tax=Shouchella xiaoxiensis TaxID=766895 RepID=A0ABS2SS75_9BACI|nr:heme o synthase [Shouchella xiaoxiensis]MBM7838367.1 protoheme IX farnesyltransferase [Shouchella xiaoxiensis]GAF14517.1 heme O synthase, protoheme IX farnesyltransferase COX10-CtaB [Bacillus sp. JCM 19045]
MRTVKIEKNIQNTSLAAPKQAFSQVLSETLKTGIIKSNLLAMMAGLSLALYITGTSFSEKIPEIFFAVLGSALVIGAAGAFNNLYDRDIDAIMDRTKNRPTVTGRMQPFNALMLGISLSIVGIILLLLATPLAALFGFLGLFLYVVPYTMWSKRRTIYNTEIGSISGAVPPLIGWSAISAEMFHPAVVGLFVVMVIWQMPHFYAIAIRRHDEYKAASVPMLPVVKGFKRTFVQTNIYLVALVLASFLFISFSWVITLVAFLLALAWLVVSIVGHKRMEPKKWATLMFVFSLNHLVILFTAIIGYSLLAPLF